MALITALGTRSLIAPFDRAAPVGELPIVVLDSDLIAEETGRACAGVGDQRLAGRQFQPEFITQELRQPLFDLLGFGLGSGEPEQMVICLCRLTDYAARNVKVLARVLFSGVGAA